MSLVYCDSSDSFYSTDKSVPECVSLLGIDTLPIYELVCWTIAIPTNHKIPFERTFAKKSAGNQREKPQRFKVAYDKLDPRSQSRFLIKYMRNVVFPNLELGVVTFELTSRGNVHAHLIGSRRGFLDGDIENIQSYADFDLHSLRKVAGMCKESILITKHKPGRDVLLNFIHRPEKGIDEWIKYMNKSPIPINNIIFGYNI